MSNDSRDPGTTKDCYDLTNHNHNRLNSLVESGESVIISKWKVSEMYIYILILNVFGYLILALITFIGSGTKMHEGYRFYTRPAC